MLLFMYFSMLIKIECASTVAPTTFLIKRVGSSLLFNNYDGPYS